MPLYKKILGRIFALYAVLLFVITLIPAYCLFKLITWFSNHKEKHFHDIFNVWMNIYLPLIACPVKIVNNDVFLGLGNCIVVVNHSSMMDIPVSTPYVPIPTKTLGKDSFARVPLFGFIYKCGTILVDRKSNRSRAESFVKMKQALQSGLSVCLYPEGTRNTTNEVLLPFQDGAFKLAIQTKKPIVPAILQGTNKIISANYPSFFLWPHPITFTFLHPINTNELSLDNCNDLKEKVRTDMLTFLNENEYNLFTNNIID